MRPWSVSFLILAGCAIPPPPQPIHPASSGGTLYVIDASVDFLDEGQPFFGSHPAAIQFLGKAAFEIVLRVLGRGRAEARLLGSAWMELESGRPAVFTVLRPLEYLHPVGGGRYEVRRSALSAPTSMEATPILSNDEKYVTVRYVLKQGAPWRKPLQDPGLDLGEPTGIHERVVEAETRVLPIGAALACSIPRDGDRVILVILHVASVHPKP